VVQAELLRRVNARLRHEVTGSRARSVWIRDLLAEGILAPLGSERIGVPERQAAEAGEIFRRATSRIEKAGYAVHGDLADLAPASAGDRLPSEVTEAELTDAATACITSLVVELRDRAAGSGATPAGVPEVPQGGRDRARNLAARALGPYENARVRRLSKRVADLEREVQQTRRLQLRVATLDDVVRELLLDPELRDTRVTWEALRDYRQDSL
jgi:hypothetical protein